MRQADIRSDLYSLGCVLYFLLTGQPPFPGGTLAQKLMRHQQAPPPPLAEKRPGLQPEIYAIVDRLLAKDPEARYQTPAELATTLAPFAGTLVVAKFADSDTMPLGPPVYALPVAVPQSKPRGVSRKRRWLLFNVAGGLLLVGLLFGLVSLLSRKRRATTRPNWKRRSPTVPSWRRYGRLLPASGGIRRAPGKTRNCSARRCSPFSATGAARRKPSRPLGC